MTSARNKSKPIIVIQFQLDGKSALTASAAPMATSESSCGPTRGATSAEEEDDEAKHINQVMVRSFLKMSLLSNKLPTNLDMTKFNFFSLIS
jgi:hypothetical protein